MKVKVKNLDFGWPQFIPVKEYYKGELINCNHDGAETEYETAVYDTTGDFGVHVQETEIMELEVCRACHAWRHVGGEWNLEDWI